MMTVFRKPQAGRVGAAGRMPPPGSGNPGCSIQIDTLYRLSGTSECIVSRVGGLNGGSVCFCEIYNTVYSDAFILKIFEIKKE